MPDDQPQDLLVVAAPLQAEGAKGFFGKEPAPVKLSQDALRENLSRFLDSVKGLLSGLPQSGAGFHVEEVEIKVEVNAEGSFQLVGGIKAGATGGITLRIKP